MARSVLINTMSIVFCVCSILSFSERCQAQVQTLSNNAAGNTGTSIGNSGSGNSAFGDSQLGLSTFGNAQTVAPQNAFIGRSDAAQNSFIGRENAQNAANNAGQNRNFNRTTAGGLQNGRNQFNTGQNTLKVPAFRPQMRVAFTAAPLPLSNIKTSMGQSFDRIKERNERLQDVQFQLNADHSVTLRGQVESASAKKLVEFLAMLEPGVRKVKNELTVAKK